MANISPHCKEAQGKSQTVKVNFWPLDAKFNTVATVNLVVDVSEEGPLHL